MQLSNFWGGFHSGINNIIFLMSYEATLLGKLKQTFRETLTAWLWKRQRLKTILHVEAITNICYRKVLGNVSQGRECVNTQLVVSRTRCDNIVACMTDKTLAHTRLAGIPVAKAQLGGKKRKWDNNIDTDLKYTYIPTKLHLNLLY